MHTQTSLIGFLAAFTALLLCPLSYGQNVIVFIGDGMGISTVTAARIFAGQQQGATGEEHSLSFERFANVALIKTYNTDAQVPDSAGTITAILSGQKTRMGVLGVNNNVPRGNCPAALQNELPSVLELAEESGRATGVVTTTRITHATPAGTYAHSADRNWEDNAALPEAAESAGCKDIARQLIEFEHGDGIDVLLGGGRANFLPVTEADPEYPDKQGRRTDGRHLINEWLSGGSARTYIWNQGQFATYQGQAAGQLLGLFEPSHLQFEADRSKDPAGEPSLTEMTRLALRQLQKNDNGYFLLVESGRIDHAHHFSNAYRALTDTVEFANAIAAAVAMVDLEKTLVLVTADHSHTLTISGYPERGNPILGKVVGKSPLPDVEAPPYTTLGYANGPGYQASYPDLSEVDTTHKDYRQIAAVPLAVETHAGEDVAAYATGLGADQLRGVMEQNELFVVITDALFR